MRLSGALSPRRMFGSLASRINCDLFGCGLSRNGTRAGRGWICGVQITELNNPAAAPGLPSWVMYLQMPGICLQLNVGLDYFKLHSVASYPFLSLGRWRPTDGPAATSSTRASLSHRPPFVLYPSFFRRQLAMT